MRSDALRVGAYELQPLGLNIRGKSKYPEEFVGEIERAGCPSTSIHHRRWNHAQPTCKWTGSRDCDGRCPSRLCLHTAPWPCSPLVRAGALTCHTFSPLLPRVPVLLDHHGSRTVHEGVTKAVEARL